MLQPVIESVGLRALDLKSGHDDRQNFNLILNPGLVP